MRLTREDDEYRFYCEPWERFPAKEAGFRFRGEDKGGPFWFTDDPSIAKALAKHADEAALTALRTANAERAAALEASRATDATIDVPVPDGLEYMPFQKAGIAFATARANTLIADEMGLGKTIQVVGLINKDMTLNSILVVCPASLKLNWKRELEKWLTRKLTVHVADSQDFNSFDADIVIINYDILRKHEAAIGATKWDALVVDECHYLKNPKTIRSKQVTAISAGRRIYLTGTPIVNRPVELWPIISALDPKTWTKFWPFAMRYCNGKHTGWGWDFSGAAHLDELQKKLRSTIMVRRLKSEVLKELPAKVRQVIELPANGCADSIKAEQDALAGNSETIEALKVAVELAKASDNPDDYKEAVATLRKGIMVAFDEMARLRHDTAVAKLPYVIEHVHAALETGSKVVVSAHHHDVVNALAAEFGKQAVVLTGETLLVKRQEAVDAFQTNENVKVFIGSIQAAGVGITLTAASHAIFAELDWVPGNVTQSEDRLHRIGQRDSVLVQHLVLEGSLDATIAKTLVRKQTVIDRALDKTVEFVDEPVVPLFDETATDTTTRERIQREAENLTPAQVAAVHEALRLLADSDPDRARVINDIGFNKIDNAIGHSLAESARLTPRQAALGKRIVLKYHRQLPAALVAAVKGEAA